MNQKETRDVLERFYGAFARRDGPSMASCYAPEATFEDPLFRLRGADIGRMWTGLLSRARDFSLRYTVAQAASGHGVVEWTARYLFAGRRRVENVVLGELTLTEGGLILTHVDRFDFPRWAAQALGVPGVMLGRFEWFRRSVGRKAAAGLAVPAKQD